MPWFSQATLRFVLESGPIENQKSHLMRRLMLLRHAKSDWAQPGARDHDRPLTERGRDSAAKMGAYMARHALVPDLVIASTATRVRETLDLLLPAFKIAPKATHDKRLYDAEAEPLLTVLKETAKPVHNLLMVGHNPGLAELAALLMASGDVEARQRLIEKFPTAGLAVIDFALDDWTKLHPKAGRLDRFVIPRTLDAETA
jgi:phosphohistidine phosphatase